MTDKMNINSITSESLFSSETFRSLDPKQKTEAIEKIASKMSPDAGAFLLESSAGRMEMDRQAKGQGRVKLDDRIQAVLLKVLPPNFNGLEKHEKLRAIDHAMPMVNEISQKIDPVNRNDTAYFVKDHLIEKIREIRGKDVGVFSDLVKRYYGQGYSTLTTSIDELATKRFLAEYITTNPANDYSKIAILAGKSGIYASFATIIIMVVLITLFVTRVFRLKNLNVISNIDLF